MARKQELTEEPARPILGPFTARLAREQKRIGALSALMNTLMRMEDYFALLGVSDEEQHTAFAPMLALLDRLLDDGGGDD